MKRLLSTLLILAIVLLSAGIGAAEGTVVAPYPADTEVNTVWGVYYAEIPDLSTIENGGYLDTTLYEQDMFTADDIKGLQPGSRVQIGGTEYTVASVTPKDDGFIEITVEGGSALFTFRPYGEYYVAEDSSGRPAATLVGDYRITLPLRDVFRYCSIDSDDNIQVYDAEQFVEIMANSTGSLDREYAVLSFGNKAPLRLVCSTKMIPFPQDAVEAARKQEENDRIKAGGGTSIKSGNISSVTERVSSSAIPAKDDTGANTGSSAGTNTASFQLVPVVWDGAGLGKCGVPAGYTMTSEVHCTDDTTCMGAPLRVSIVAESSSIPSVLGFYCSEYYVDRVKGRYSNQKDGALDGQLHVFVMGYQDAAGHCDYIASKLAPGATYYKDEDTSFFNSALEKHRKEFDNELEAGLRKNGIKVNWYDITAAHRVYTYDNDGTTYAICVMTEVDAYQSNAAGIVSTFWEVPGYYYMICPLSDYERVHSTDFQVFIENTAASDTFIQLVISLNNEIQRNIQAGWAAAIRASNAYASAMNALMTQSVNDYLSSSSYSASDRFSDYIFDRNEYTTSDGYSVSISTSYDYVWEDSGTVYYSNSSFDVPSNATMLSPIR